MQRQIKAGHAADAGLIFHIFAMDSTSTSGAGKASVAFGSWTCYYIRAGGAISGAITPQDITTIGTYAAPTANTNIRIKAVDNTNMIGVYELQLHLDWVATGSESLTIYLTASGVAPIALTIPLTAIDPQDSVRAGLTALPNAAAAASGGLMILGSNNTAAITIGALTVGAISGTTLTLSGAVAFQSTFAVTTSTSLGAISGSTLTLSGAVAFQSTFATTGTTTFNAFTVTNALTVSGATTFTGAISGTNASNDIRGILLQATQTGVTIPTVTTVTNQLTAAQIATGVWQDSTAGDFTAASSIGKSLYTGGVVPGGTNGLFIAGTNAATTVTTAFTTTFTGNLTGSVDSVTGAVGSVTGAVGSVTGAVGSVTGNVGGNVTGSVGSLATQAKADVNAEVVDVLATDTYAESTAIPSATSSLATKITFLGTLARNKITQTATTQTLYRDDGSTTVGTNTQSDNGTTYTRGEWA